MLTPGARCPMHSTWSRQIENCRACGSPSGNSESARNRGTLFCESLTNVFSWTEKNVSIGTASGRASAYWEWRTCWREAQRALIAGCLTQRNVCFKKWKKKSIPNKWWKKASAEWSSSWVLNLSPGEASELLDVLCFDLGGDLGFPGGSDGKESAYNEGDWASIPGSGRSSGEGNGNPLQYSCLENSMDRGHWWATVHVVTKLLLLSCFSRVQLCNPIDGSPPGSTVPGILQARTLEWAAISFSNTWKWTVKVKSLSHVRLFATPWTATYQAPPSMGFSRQEYWSGLPLPSPQRVRHNWAINMFMNVFTLEKFNKLNIYDLCLFLHICYTYNKHVP